MTSFNHVRLPRYALLGDVNEDPKWAFTLGTARIAIGSLSLSLLSIGFMSISAYIAGKYSLRRTVINAAGHTTPIWSFRTQQLPILHSLAQLFVSRVYAHEVIGIFQKKLAQRPVDDRGLIGLSVTVKAALLERMKPSLTAMGERCGSQGLFEENQLIAIQVCDVLG